jgi:carboxylesterase type B
MIFGESAGSGSVSYMQATPLAKGLFHAADLASRSDVDAP